MSTDLEIKKLKHRGRLGGTVFGAHTGPGTESPLTCHAGTLQRFMRHRVGHAEAFVSVVGAN